MYPFFSVARGGSAAAAAPAPKLPSSVRESAEGEPGFADHIRST
jgi:hypothetical protein